MNKREVLRAAVVRLPASWLATATSPCLRAPRPGAQTPPLQEAPAPPSLQRPASLSYCFKSKIKAEGWFLPGNFQPAQCGGRCARCLAPAVSHTGRSYTACAPFLEGFKQRPGCLSGSPINSREQQTLVLADGLSIAPACLLPPAASGGRFTSGPEFCPVHTRPTHVLAGQTLTSRWALTVPCPAACSGPTP